MVVEILREFRVKSYEKVYKMYQNGELGIVEQRMLGDIARETEGTEMEKIINLLNQDTDNLYQVVRVKKDGEVRYLITIIGVGFIKTFDSGFQYSLTFGEDGVWEEGKMKDEVHWKDASNNSLEIYNG